MKIRRILKRAVTILPKGIIIQLKRLIVAKRVFSSRPHRAEDPFNNPLDLAVAVDPFYNHIWKNYHNEIDMVIKCSTRAAMTTQELINLYRLVQATSKLKGDIAEVGVFKGGSAKLIGYANGGKRKIHLFDTFAGIPETTVGVDVVPLSSFMGGLNEVKEYLNDNIGDYQFHVGFFPATTKELAVGTAFSFVNLDMDTYASTKHGLEFFYPLMVPGGVIVGHDYYAESCPGVKKAFDEFLVDKEEILVGLWHSQAMFIKCKG